MKVQHFILAFAATAMLFTACEEKQIMPGDNDNNQEGMRIELPDTNGIEISVDSARKICHTLPDNGTTGELYKLSGIIVGNTTHPYQVPSRYRDINFQIWDEKNDTSWIDCYTIRNINNIQFRNSNEIPRSGSKVTVLGYLTKYVNKAGTKTTPELKEGFIVRIDSMVCPEFPGCPEPGAGEISVNRAQYIADSINSGNTSKDTYKILGVVVTVDATPADIKKYGNVTFSISSDGTSYATCYRLKGINDINKIAINDTVLVEAKIQNYNGICEPTSGSIIKSTNPNFPTHF